MSDNDNRVSFSFAMWPMSTLWTIGVALVVLKCAGIIDFPWVVVTLPIYIGPLAIATAAAAIALIVTVMMSAVSFVGVVAGVVDLLVRIGKKRSVHVDTDGQNAI